MPMTEVEDHQNQRQQDAQHMGNPDENRNFNVNIKKESNKWYPAHWHSCMAGAFWPLTECVREARR